MFTIVVDILQGREREFLLSLQELEREPLFSVAKLEFQVDKIKTCVAEVSVLVF